MSIYDRIPEHLLDDVSELEKWRYEHRHSLSAEELEELDFEIYMLTEEPVESAAWLSDA